jgi:uncharacterized membrane protein YozB (DUF420 family)
MPIEFLLHVLLMLLAAILMITAIIIAHKKKTPSWFKMHRILAVLGVASALTGGAIMFFHKMAMGYPHFKSIHALLGLLSIILLVITPVIGNIMIAGYPKLRPAHRILGRITAAAVLLAVFAGVMSLLKIVQMHG